MRQTQKFGQAFDWVRQEVKRAGAGCAECRQSGGKAVALHAVLTRLSVFNPDHECWPSLETLADMSMCSVSSVKRALKVLETVGAVRVHRGWGEVWTKRNRYDFGGSGRHAVYEVAFEDPFIGSPHLGHYQGGRDV